ncbi:putative transporter MCH1 [Tolypocladium ophioglossoides CBS 100239]|uniref:Probable transporter MCH1 n=1 Tax=Tolypocladium ophioglossoides (strain CBS 100239) TaxID=1163406 RepID=A0A0L0NKI8_TOLOC|nr:putative transporter MCH1 [Tolypocladium ophioglossoides CBS 100239]
MPTSATSDDRTLVAPPVDSDQASTLSIRHDYNSDSDSFEPDAALRRRQLHKKQLVRIVSLICATLAALCAGSIVVFSLYAPKFQSRLHYTQFQVNGVAIAGSLSLYLPISVMGYVCDRIGVAPLALLSSVLFGTGYGLAATLYRKLDIDYNVLGKPHGPGNEWSYLLMIFAFVCVGSATCAMYIASISTCAKNFGKGKYRGLALAMPITGFGLSGMWLSQFGSRFLYETNADGSRGDIDVFRFFVFLAILLFVMGIIGTFTLRVVDEQDLIEEAIEELENSGLLDGSALLGRSDRGYETAGPTTPAGDLDSDPLLHPSKGDDAKWKKNWVLNAETRQFLTDHTMWPFALAFLFMIGPGEAFINNLGTVIGTLTPPTSGFGEGTSAATHVSVFGVTSTIARLLIGTMTDLLAPAPETQHVQVAPNRSHHRSSPLRHFAISRVVFLLFFGVLMSIGLIFLASGAVQNHADRFWVVSGLVGAGYGATFSLTPLIVTIIWGVENFATNFGIIAMLPALGSTFWGLVYSAVYQAGAQGSGPAKSGSGSDDGIFCYGKQCYSATFWAEGICVWVACVLLFWAWKGKGGWQQRGIVI